ncbi:MAG TPA: hypothetical protein VFX97_20530 [Pyrinomonadaceae bacterium]|nr:hypothetical protein [Pyrinomonadaceae bacterium]
MNNRITTRRQCNHVLHLVLSIITFGMWLPVWAVAAVLGRRETVTCPGAYPPALVQGGPHAVPAPVPNAVNPYNGHRYYDPSRPPLTYPPGHPVHYGR